MQLLEKKSSMQIVQSILVAKTYQTAKINPKHHLQTQLFQNLPVKNYTKVSGLLLHPTHSWFHCTTVIYFKP